MEIISKLLCLSDDAVAIYLKCLGKNPLTYKEIHTFNLNLSDAKFKEIINELVDNKLLLNKTPKKSQILTHYIAMPPFFLINNLITQIKNDLTESNKTNQGSDFKIFNELLTKTEEELKKTITSELADISITLIQLKSELNEKLNAIGFKDSEWDILHDYIKFKLSLKTHDKAREIGSIISEKFKKFDTIPNIQQNIPQDDNLLTSIQFIEDFIQIILKYYSELNFFIFDKFWPIISKKKICEEISTFLLNSREKALIIIPELKDYIIIEELNKFAANLKITLISSESHNNPLVQKVKKIENIEYLRLENNNFIGLNKDNDSYIVIGISQENEKNPLKNVIGFGTTYKPLIEQLSPLFLEKLKKAKPSNDKQITDGFNQILQNINEIKGKKISKILREVLNAAEKMEENSLNILEIKLLINKLQTVNQPLDTETKNQIIEKINKFNDIFSKLKLKPHPELKSQPIPKKEILENISKVDLESITTEEFESLFNLFLEKLKDFKGTTISKQIESLIDLSLEYQGYSEIIEWKNQLKSINQVLEKPFKEKLEEDFTKWKKNLIKPKISEISIQKQVYEPAITKPIVPTHNDVFVSHSEKKSEPDIVDYTPTFSISEAPPEDTAKKQGNGLKEQFDDIIQKVNTLKGVELSKEFLNLIDTLLETQGYSMALKDMRQWLNKIKSIKTTLEEELKIQLVNELGKWREQFT